jgi:excisionase family DNA binding protein
MATTTPSPESGDILTLQEAADFLKVSSRTLWSLFSEGKVPGFKVGGQIRFNADSLRAWVRQQEGGAA